jgi:hypothetical protein
MWLRQSTASQEIIIGPFLDDTDGKTQETALTIAASDIKLWAEGGTTEASKNSGGATHIAAGRYYAVFDATDTATLGKLEINVHVTGALPVRREFMVLPANVYDSLVLGTASLSVGLAAAGLDAILSRNVSNVETTMPEHCIGTIILAVLEWAISGGNWVIKGTDGSTTRFTKPLTTAAGVDGVTGVS